MEEFNKIPRITIGCGDEEYIDREITKQLINDNFIPNSQCISKEEVDVEKDGVDEAYCMWYRCKNCGDDMITEDSVYCPSCGRKIRITN